MKLYWLLTVLPVICLFSNVVLQVIYVQFTSRIGLSMAAGFILGFVVNLAVLAYMTGNGVSLTGCDAGVSILTYLCLSFCFWAFLNLNITSIRIRVVRELLDKQDQGLSLEELTRQYSPDEMMRRRIERLSAAGQIVKLNGTWRLQSQKLLFFERLFSILRNLIIPMNTGARDN